LPVPYDRLVNAAEPLEHQEIIILGTTEAGKTFRPSDWAERLCGVLAHFTGDQRLRYSPQVTPSVRDGVKCVIIDARLKLQRPEAFAFLLGFARDNRLVLKAGPRGQAGILGAPPTQNAA
jgi:hypothetical protein